MEKNILKILLDRIIHRKNVKLLNSGQEIKKDNSRNEFLESLKTVNGLENKYSKKYISKSKQKYMNVISKMEGKTSAQNAKLYEELFFAVDKLDNLDILQDFLNENNLTEQFINSNIYPLWNGYRDEKLSKLENFSSKIGIDYLENKFGTKFANKLQNAYFKKKINYLDVLSLIKISYNKEILDNNKEQINDLFDLFSREDIKVGIHRTGGYVSGEKIEQEGLYLTGHISSGAVVTSNRETIENTLERNVSFYDSPGIAIKAIYDGGTYKNSNEKADIMLIGIPKDKFENNDRNLIETIDGQQTLKRDYVLGYVSINNKTKLIEKLSSNSYLKNEIKNKEIGGERNEF